ncbi:MAG: amidohydrolase family protein [Candidatus Hodarchaeota archaeon]
MKIDDDILDFYRGDIIDVHNHLFTHEILEKMIKELTNLRFVTFDHRYKLSSTKMYKEEKSTEEVLKDWIREMDMYGITKLVLFPFKGFHEEIFKAATMYPDRIIPFIWADMKNPEETLNLLKKGVKKHGVRGVKFNPSADHVHPKDRSLYDLYFFMDKNQITALFHYGISMAPLTDVEYINPLDIQVPARDFPELDFIVAHMGAGYVRECLFLMYHDYNENIFFDCSGSGAWLQYLSNSRTFEDVYKRFIDAGGVEKILFGTDSNLRGYRVDVLKQNLQIFKNLGLKEDEVKKIMCNNAKKVLKI